MKTSPVRPLTILALAALVAGLTLAFAQEKQDTKPDPKADPKAEVKAPRRDRTTALMEYLKLTDEQKAKVKPVLDEEYKKVAELRASTTGTAEEKQTKIKELRDASNAKINPLLKPDQLAKWEVLRRVRPPTSPPPTQPPPDKPEPKETPDAN